MSAKLTPEEVLGLACALGFWGRLKRPDMTPEKVREEFCAPDLTGAAYRMAWAAAAHETCSMAAILRAEAQAVVNERKRAAVEPGDGIVEDDYTGVEATQLVCAICGADAVLDEEGAYRHAKRPFEDQSMFCDRQGYPVKVRLVQVKPSPGDS